MTDIERAELLKEVVMAAPDKMGAKIVNEGLVVFTKVDRHESLDLADGDHGNAFAIIAMLDAMEVRDLGGLGPEVLIELIGSEGEYRCRRWVCPESDSAVATTDEGGATRTEAVARAFVAVFSKGKAA